jgi:heme/copper-type cytochrome/quinol oxidase subunit 3
MNIAVAVDDEVRHEARPSASEAGPAAKRIVVGYGFWIFLLSDVVMFAALFAAYAVLTHATAGGPSGVRLFNQGSAAIETGCLLASSYTACPVEQRFKRSRRAVKLDDPSFNAAIFANLFDGEDDTYNLIWSRGRRQNAD